MENYWNKPLAADGLTFYRYAGRYGWVMIGAQDDPAALREAARSTPDPTMDKLQVWDGTQYVDVGIHRDIGGYGILADTSYPLITLFYLT